jgi:glutamyl-tRNA reductase
MIATCQQTSQERSDTTHVFLVGLNYRTAPLALREQLALTDDEVRRALADLLALHPAIYEAVVITTCNRLEIYVASTQPRHSREQVETFLARLRHLPVETLRPHLYTHLGRGAVEHLMRVAAGVDSMILGEPQILAQVNQALATAQAIAAAGPILSHLFTQAAHAGKRARNETGISRHITSISHAAVHLAQAQFSAMADVQALVVGSGEMAYLAAQAFQRYNVATIRCINRTYARAEDLAREFNGEALDWYLLPQALAEADVVISATGAPHTVIHARDVAQALAQRQQRPLVMIDIALPRDVDAGVSALPNVHYYDLDDLNAFVETNVARREAAINDVEAIIQDEVGRFNQWLSGHSVAPVIVALREKATDIADDEVAAALRRLGELDADQQKVVERLAHRIVNKLLHDPTTRLKAGAANDAAPCYAHIVRDLFALDETG